MISFKFIATDGKRRVIRSERNYDALIEQLEEKMNKKLGMRKNLRQLKFVIRKIKLASTFMNIMKITQMLILS